MGSLVHTHMCTYDTHACNRADEHTHVCACVHTSVYASIHACALQRQSRTQITAHLPGGHPLQLSADYLSQWPILIPGNGTLMDESMHACACLSNVPAVFLCSCETFLCARARAWEYTGQGSCVTFAPGNFELTSPATSFTASVAAV